MLKRYKPYTPGTRQLIIVDKSSLLKSSPNKQLSRGLPKSSGRNNRGRITVFHRGGGNKRKYRFLDSKTNFNNVIVESIEYDPNRSGFIALIRTKKVNQFKNFKSYILASDGLKVGDTINNDSNLNNIGQIIRIKDVPIGVTLFNIELEPNKGFKLCRAAGTFASLLKKDFNLGYGLLSLPSGKRVVISLNCRGMIGRVSNLDHSSRVLGKAGRSRWLGKRPVVRGVAMNTIDHPHGGGRGKTKGGRPSVTPWGRLTKGKPTRIAKHFKRRNTILNKFINS